MFKTFEVANVIGDPFFFSDREVGIPYTCLNLHNVCVGFKKSLKISKRY